MWFTHRRIPYAVFLVAWLALAQVAWAGKGSVVTGKHYRVICDFKNKDVAKAALETAEAVWPTVMESWGVDGDKVKEPLKVYLYQTLKAYEAAEAKRTGGRFRENLSFSHHKDKTAHILVQPICSDAVLARVSLPGLTRMLIAHESVHLATYATIPNHALHPEWMNEGLAIDIAVETLLKKGWLQSLEEDPYSCMMLMRAWKLATEGTLPSIDTIIYDACKHLELQDRYAVYWQFCRFMKRSELKVSFGAIRAQARSMKGPEEFNERLSKFILDRIGSPDDVRIWNQQFREKIIMSHFNWEEPCRSTDMRRDHWVQIAFPSKTAMVVSTKPVTHRTFSIEGSFELLPNGAATEEVCVYVGLREIGSLMVAFSPQRGIKVERQFLPEARDEILTSAKSKRIKLEKPVLFEIKVAQNQLEVFIDGKSRAKCDIGDHNGTGNWGLGAAPGNAVIWRNVKVNERQ